MALCAQIVGYSWNDEHVWKRPRISQVTLSFLLLLMLVKRAPGSSSTEVEISALFRSGLMRGSERVRDTA